MQIKAYSEILRCLSEQVQLVLINITSFGVGFPIKNKKGINGLVFGFSILNQKRETEPFF